jgi:hypothetical protein
LHEQEYEDVGWAIYDGEAHHYGGLYIVARCETCKQILLYNSIEGNDPALEYPDISLDDSVPKHISEIYEEAIRIKHLAPNAFAVQIRRALEAICKDRGTKKKYLVDQIKELADKGEIPANLVEASDVLRLIGNIGAHANKHGVHPLQAMAINEFFKALIEYVYVSPDRMMQFKSSLGKYKKSQEKTGSSAESVGFFRLRQIAKRVI